MNVTSSSTFSKRYYVQQNIIIFKCNRGRIFRINTFNAINNLLENTKIIIEKIISMRVSHRTAIANCIIFFPNCENFHIKFRQILLHFAWIIRNLYWWVRIRIIHTSDIHIWQFSRIFDITIIESLYILTELYH